MTIETIKCHYCGHEMKVDIPEPQERTFQQIQFAPYEPQPITPFYYRTVPTTGDPLPMPPYEVTCKFGKVED